MRQVLMILLVVLGGWTVAMAGVEGVFTDSQGAESEGAMDMLGAGAVVESSVSVRVPEASNKGGRRLRLMTDSLALLGGVPNLELETPISKTWSLGLRGYMAAAYAGLADAEISGFGVRANYLFGNHPDESSWYFGLGADFSLVRVNLLGFKAGGLAIDPDFAFGYQWVGETFIAKLALVVSAVNTGLGASVGVTF